MFLIGCVSIFPAVVALKLYKKNKTVISASIAIATLFLSLFVCYFLGSYLYTHLEVLTFDDTISTRILCSFAGIFISYAISGLYLHTSK